MTRTTQIFTAIGLATVLSLSGGTVMAKGHDNGVGDATADDSGRNGDPSGTVTGVGDGPGASDFGGAQGGQGGRSGDAPNNGGNGNSDGDGGPASVNDGPPGQAGRE